ncbi:hypothetical protein FACS1894139_07110 [Planctomycetales bacterium]|nr:hypothetical protein FACS1894107_04970 [Planctomycetales bacterium]GHT04636.1 hypothetical protein FACS1894139_07110 [Planctomycetales bacterium]
MKKLLLLSAALALVGCGHAEKSATRSHGAAAPSADEQIINHAVNTGMVVNQGYTIPTTEAETAAQPEDVLYDVNGEPYKVVGHIGLKDEQ